MFYYTASSYLFSNKNKTQERYKHTYTHAHIYIYISVSVNLDFPCGSAGKESTCNVEDLGLNPGKIPWKRERLLIPVFWPGECGWASSKQLKACIEQKSCSCSK